MRGNKSERQPDTSALNEADTCRKFVVPKFQAAGWDNEPHSIAEQRALTDGRVIVWGNRTELDALPVEADTLTRLQTETAAELNALLPAILDRAFKGELEFK